MQISILIVTHNHEKYIGKLIESLEKFKYKDVFFCDAYSTDLTVSIIKNSSYKKNILEKNILESFSKNNNDIIKEFNLYHYDFYFVLNPDTFFHEDILKNFKIFFNKQINKNQTWIYAPKILYPNGEIQNSWKKYPNISTTIKKRLGLRLRNTTSYDYNQTQTIEWALGAALFIHKDLYNTRKNLFDERYRLYCEDSDICFFTQQQKHNIIGVKDIIIYHHLQESSTKIFSIYNYWNISSLFKFIFKWNIHYLRYLFRNWTRN